MVMLGILKLIVLIMLINHLIACLWLGICTWDPTPKDTWVQACVFRDESFRILLLVPLHDRTVLVIDTLHTGLDGGVPT